jgi:hypothetical protein
MAAMAGHIFPPGINRRNQNMRSHAEEFVAMHLDFFAARYKTMSTVSDEASELITHGADASALAVIMARACAEGAGRDPDDPVAVIDQLLLLIECATKPAHAAFREGAKQMIKLIISQKRGRSSMPSDDFKPHLIGFLTQRARGLNKEDILRGVSWEDEQDQRHYFRLRDLQKYLDYFRMHLSQSDITSRIVALHASADPAFEPHMIMRIKRSNVHVWWVPSSVVPNYGDLPV